MVNVYDGITIYVSWNEFPCTLYEHHEPKSHLFEIRTRMLRTGVPVREVRLDNRPSKVSLRFSIRSDSREETKWTNFRRSTVHDNITDSYMLFYHYMIRCGWVMCCALCVCFIFILCIYIYYNSIVDDIYANYSMCPIGA